MIEILKREVVNFTTREEKFNHLREVLQILILKIIYDTGLFSNLVFTGGTALRILFDLRRFSEDLDFSLVNKKGYELSQFSHMLENQLDQYGLEVELSKKDKKVVHQVDIKFKRILFDLGISSLPGQKLFIRVEIDTNPPSGGKTEISLISRTFIFSVAHFDLSSLYATKLHACFFRKYVKGRDFYDLLWYLGKRVEPNYRLLNSAIRQTCNGKFTPVSKSTFKDFLAEELRKIDFARAKRDVGRFLEDKKELEFIDRKTFLNLSTKI